MLENCLQIHKNDIHCDVHSVRHTKETEACLTLVYMYLQIHVVHIHVHVYV